MAVGFYKGYSYGALQTDTYLPVTEEQASFVIGFNFRMSLGDVMKKVIERHPMEIFGEVSSWKQQEFEKQLERYGFQRYADTFLKEAHPDIFSTSEPFKHVNGISSLPAMANELRQNNNIVCLHTADDFLLTDYDRNWLKRQMGDRLVMLDHGSHLGYFCMPQALDIIVKLIKGETVSGPRPSTAKPTYTYFDTYLRQMAAAKQGQAQQSQPKQTAPTPTTVQTTTAKPAQPAAQTTVQTAQPVQPVQQPKQNEMTMTVVKKDEKGAPVIVSNPTTPPPAPQTSMIDGRKVEWRLVPDPEDKATLKMQQVDVESGLVWEEYQAKAKAEAEAKAKKIAEKALADAEREREAKEREEKAERDRIRNAEKAKAETLEATKKSEKAKPKKTAEEVKKTVSKNTKKGGSNRGDVKMESTAPEEEPKEE